MSFHLDRLIFRTWTAVYIFLYDLINLEFIHSIIDMFLRRIGKSRVGFLLLPNLFDRLNISSNISNLKTLQSWIL